VPEEPTNNILKRKKERNSWGLVARLGCFQEGTLGSHSGVPDLNLKSGPEKIPTPQDLRKMSEMGSFKEGETI